MQLFTKEKQYANEVALAATKYGVPASLIMGHIKQESSFNPLAYRAEPSINDASYGMMQLLLNTAKTLDTNVTVEKLYNPGYNIDLGTKYISQNLKRYPNDIQSAIAAYNAGSAYKTQDGKYISKSGNDVQKYVDNVYKNMQVYENWIKGGEQSIQTSWLDIIIPVAIAGLLIWIIIRRKNKNVEGDTA